MTDLLIWIAIGYLLGSLPTGVLLGRMVGRDPRKGGSGNIGASNVTRTLGKKLGFITLAVDALKGAVPAALALHWADLDVACAAGVAAVLGHCYPVWLKFRGGKGVATAFGTMAVYAPAIAMLSALVWIAALVVWRTPAVGSLIIAVLFVVLPHLDHQPFSVHAYAVLVSLIILVRHANNIRLLREQMRPSESQRMRRKLKKKKKNKKKRRR